MANTPTLRNLIDLVESAGGEHVLDEVRKTPPLPSHPDEDEKIAGRQAEGEVIGTIDGLEVRLDDADSGVAFVTLVEDERPVGFATFDKRSADHFQIAMLRLVRRLRSRGVMPRVLLMLAQRGIMVQSGSEQTSAAVRMWASLYGSAPSEGCKVCAMHADTGKLVPLVSPTRTAIGRAVYGARTPFTLVLVKGH